MNAIKYFISFILGAAIVFAIMAFVTNEVLAKVQAERNRLETENYNLKMREPVITPKKKAEIKCEGSGKFFAECVAWELKEVENAK